PSLRARRRRAPRRSSHALRSDLFCQAAQLGGLALRKGADELRERDLAGLGRGAAERVLHRARQVFGLAEPRRVDDDVALAAAAEQAALGKPVEDGLHRVVRALMMGRQRLADLLDGAVLEPPDGGHDLRLELALERSDLGHGQRMIAEPRNGMARLGTPQPTMWT